MDTSVIWRSTNANRIMLSLAANKVLSMLRYSTGTTPEARVTVCWHARFFCVENYSTHQKSFTLKCVVEV